MTKTQKAAIDAKALRIVERVRNDDMLGMDASEFIYTEFNGLRGMCPDGCCGGLQELDPEDRDPEAVEIDRYMVRLRNRAYEIFGLA